jgi:hypothetical protein
MHIQFVQHDFKAELLNNPKIHQIIYRCLKPFLSIPRQPSRERGVGVHLPERN